MAWNGSGTFSMLYSWVARRDAGSPTNIIGATEMDAQFADIKTGLETCVTRDGQNAATANLPMGGFLHINVGAATSRTNYGRVAELQDGTIYKAASPGGTGDAMTGTIAPAPSAYTAGMRVTIVAPGANTVSNPTINVNALGVKTIRKHQGTLTIPEYATGDTLELIYDGTGFELMNPKTPYAVGMTSFTTDATGGAMNDLLPFIDASESNADNKVTVQSFLDNVHANATVDTTLGATGDKLLLTDASESNATQATTIDNVIINALQLLTSDSTGGALTDYIPFADASESNAGNKVLVSDLFYNVINNATADTAPDATADYVLELDASASGIKKTLHKYIGVGKQTAYIPAGAMVSRTTNGPSSGTTESTTNKIMSKTLDYDAATQEHAQFQIAFPKGWDLGTVTAIFYWTATNTGNVVWGLQGVAISDDDVLDAAFGTAQEVTDGVTATTDVMVSAETSAITIAGTPAVGDIVVFQAYRKAADAADTCTVDAKLLGIRLIYTINSTVDN